MGELGATAASNPEISVSDSDSDEGGEGESHHASRGSIGGDAVDVVHQRSGENVRRATADRNTITKEKNGGLDWCVATLPKKSARCSILTRLVGFSPRLYQSFGDC